MASDFGSILKTIVLYPNKKMTRMAWDSYSYITLVDNECFLKHNGTGFVIWKPTHADLLAVDWEQYVAYRDKQGDLLNRKENPATMRDQLITGTPMPADVAGQLNELFGDGSNEENE